jgi:hypothetical protein
MTDETLIDYALNQQPTKFGDAVNAMLQQKAMDALEQLRGNVAYSMYGEGEAPEEEIGDGEEELSLDDDDADEFEEEEEYEDTDDSDLEDMLDDLDLDAELEGLDDEDA